MDLTWVWFGKGVSVQQVSVETERKKNINFCDLIGCIPFLTVRSLPPKSKQTGCPWTQNRGFLLCYGTITMKAPGAHAGYRAHLLKRFINTKTFRILRCAGVRESFQAWQRINLIASKNQSNKRTSQTKGPNSRKNLTENNKNKMKSRNLTFEDLNIVFCQQIGANWC